MFNIVSGSGYVCCAVITTDSLTGNTNVPCFCICPYQLMTRSLSGCYKCVSIRVESHKINCMTQFLQTHYVCDIIERVD